MVVTTLPLTLYLAQAIGLYMILVGVSALVRPALWAQVMDEFAASAALPLVTGVFTFALGVTLIFAHSVLTDPLAIAVTAVGWIALLKGAMLIVVPHLSQRLGRWSVRFIRIWAVLVLVLGLLIGLAGLTGTAGYPHIV